MSQESTAAGSRLQLTPGRLLVGCIILLGLIVTFLRFTQGLGAVTNLDHNTPWGLWISFDLLCGVALAAGGFVTSAAVYIFGLHKYHFAVRPAVLTGFLGYALVVLALTYDVGIPWRLPYPFIVQPGPSSFLFEVGLCVALYLTVLFLEISPAALEWLGKRRLRSIVVKMTLVLTIFGVILSTLHQSSLGGLYLIAPSKLHPLWYSAYLPLGFFISSIVAGLSMVIFEGALSSRFMKHKMDAEHIRHKDDLAIGFAKAGAVVLAGYFFIQLSSLAADNDWAYLSTGYGAWYLLEIGGFVALPCLLFALGAREKNVRLIRWTAVLAVLGIVLNRFNVSLVAFNWHLAPDQRYFPSWMEFSISIFLVTLGVLAYTFVVTRMPVLFEHPEYAEE
ncbi:sulfate respiration complex protein HmcC [Desulfovermiculus halophilus]|uniref:sulfate respiration complex protein HmcC n=1 Tax=Desulfovermiculus halophilus TaxID=339722 RepID=UPI000489CD8C|nr:Ni/Fe-hydrogenase cytochrome b subunit [Desulfovermiculus halophilus]